MAAFWKGGDLSRIEDWGPIKNGGVGLSNPPICGHICFVGMTAQRKELLRIYPSLLLGGLLFYWSGGGGGGGEVPPVQRFIVCCT